MFKDRAAGRAVRYADDIIVTARTRAQAILVQAAVGRFLARRGLELSPEKTRIVDLREEGFDFVSRYYSLRGTQLVAEPSDASVARFMAATAELVSSHKGSQRTLIEKLNHRIVGFASYHKVGDAKYAYLFLDAYISALLLDCCEKKHPRWTREHILARYWAADTKGRMRYSLPENREFAVRLMQDTVLVRHNPVRVTANAFEIENFFDYIIGKYGL